MVEANLHLDEIRQREALRVLLRAKLAPRLIHHLEGPVDVAVCDAMLVPDPLPFESGAAPDAGVAE